MNKYFLLILAMFCLGFSTVSWVSFLRRAGVEVRESPRVINPLLHEIIDKHVAEMLQAAYDLGYTAGYDAGKEDEMEWEPLEPFFVSAP